MFRIVAWPRAMAFGTPSRSPRISTPSALLMAMSVPAPRLEPAVKQDQGGDDSLRLVKTASACAGSSPGAKAATTE